MDTRAVYDTVRAVPRAPITSFMPVYVWYSTRTALLFSLQKDTVHTTQLIYSVLSFSRLLPLLLLFFAAPGYPSILVVFGF